MTATGSPAAGRLYDARRDVYYIKPVLRGWMHLLWFAASLLSGPLLIARAHGAAQITAAAVYSASVTPCSGSARCITAVPGRRRGGSACSGWTTR